MTEETTTCKACSKEISTLAVFPGGICVECYAKTEEANRPLTASTLTGMWGKANLS